MSDERAYKKIDWTPEDRARHKAIRERFQKDRPSLQQLVASGDTPAPMPLGVYFELRAAMRALQQARVAAGLSLADVAERAGIDAAAISRLESGTPDSPTVGTLVRYAAAVGKRLTWRLQDAPAAGPA